jgi:hypothetical protein
MSKQEVRIAAHENSTIRDFNILEHYFGEYIDTENKYRRFDVPNVAILGWRRSRVPTKLVSLLSDCRDRFGSAYLFSSNRESRMYSTIFKSALRYFEPTEDVLRAIQAMQEYLIERRPSFLKPEDIVCLVVIDACDTTPFLESGYFAQFVSDCRRSSISLWMMCPTVNYMTPALIKNVDVLVAPANQSVKQQQKLFAEFFDCFESFEAFIEAFEDCTKCFGSIVWCNAGMDDGMAASVFRFKHSNTDFNSFSLRLPLQSLFGTKQMCKLGMPAKLHDMMIRYQDHELEQHEKRLEIERVADEKQLEIARFLQRDGHAPIVIHEEEEDGFVLGESDKQ